MADSQEDPASEGGWFWRRWLRSNGPQTASALFGKRAATRTDLESEARSYVSKRMYYKGGWGEACLGFWHKTGPAIFGSRESFNFRAVLILGSWVLLLAGSAIVPVLGKRALQGASLPTKNVDAFWAIMTNLQPLDYLV